VTTILAKFEKQPSEIQDYDIDFSEYLNALSDSAVSAVVTGEIGITVVAHSLIGNVVKVWLSGGDDGETYKITVLLTTSGGRKREADIKVKVKEA
jgi:hypothetical protein